MVAGEKTPATLRELDAAEIRDAAAVDVATMDAMRSMKTNLATSQQLNSASKSIKKKLKLKKKRAKEADEPAIEATAEELRPAKKKKRAKPDDASAPAAAAAPAAGASDALVRRAVKAGLRKTDVDDRVRGFLDSMPSELAATALADFRELDAAGKLAEVGNRAGYLGGLLRQRQRNHERREGIPRHEGAFRGGGRGGGRGRRPRRGGRGRGGGGGRRRRRRAATAATATRGRRAASRTRCSSTSCRTRRRNRILQRFSPTRRARRRRRSSARCAR